MLDNCVDAELGNLLRQHGHDAFTAAEVGISEASDDTINVAAQERNAALISHDVKFSRARRRRTIGQHVWMHCSQPRAIAVLSVHLDEVVHLLQHMPNVVIEVRQASVIVPAGRWT